MALSLPTLRLQLKPDRNLIPPTSNGNSKLIPAPGVARPTLHPGALAVRNVASTETDDASPAGTTSRRSANYHASIWTHTVITESMTSTYSDPPFLVRREELKLEAKKLLLQPGDEQPPLALLRTVDAMERLCVAYHFEEEIKRALHHYHESCYASAGSCEELALGFRLLRQHGYRASPEGMVYSFKDLITTMELIIKEQQYYSSSQDDNIIRCMLALYEASHLANSGDQAELGEIQSITYGHLKSLLLGKIIEGGGGINNNNNNNININNNLGKQVEQSLEMPLHWTMPRLEGRRYMDVYETDQARIPILLELAKLDFNVVQSQHQSELRMLSRWWKGLGLVESLPFSRDRLVENYLWAMGIAFEPQFSDVRLCLTKLVCILTVIDDVYDVYGSFDELELFTSAVESWNIESTMILPEYLKPCFLALYNFVDEVACEISEVQGWDAKPFVCKEWKRLCKGYFLEAKWFKNGYKSTLKEYLENAWITVGGPLAMVHTYLLQGSIIPNKSADCLDSSQALKLISLSSLITRISDDLGTSKVEMERGDTLKTIECFMSETGESEEVSREHIKNMVGDLWKELNEECHRTQLISEDFVRMVVNMARTAQCIFQYGDGIGTSTGVTRDTLISLFVKDVKL